MDQGKAAAAAGGDKSGKRGVKMIKIHPIHALRYHDETHCRQLIYTSERIEVRES